MNQGGTIVYQSNVAKLIARAESIIEKKWIKGNYRDGHGGYCAVGALRQAQLQLKAEGLYIPYSDVDEAQARLLKYANEGRNMQYTWLPNFNDAPETKKEDVLNIFKKALAKAKKMVVSQ